MHNYFSKILVTFMMVFLAGCQSNPAGRATLFSTYPTFPSFSSSSADTNVTQAVESALSNSGDPFVAKVHVETRQKTVVLSGYVKKIRQSDFAEQIAHQFSGGLNVQNNIVVRP